MEGGRGEYFLSYGYRRRKTWAGECVCVSQVQAISTSTPRARTVRAEGRGVKRSIKSVNYRGPKICGN